MSRQQTRNHGRAGQRLASISHHFLSDVSADTLPTGLPQSKSVTIVDQRHGSFPTLALAATVARLGIECHVREHGQTDIRLRPVAKAKEHLHPLSRQSSLHMHISDTVDAVSDTAIDTLLFAISASDKSVRDGFMRLKYYLSVMRPNRIGLTLMECPDINLARHYYAVMKQACRDFLSTSIFSYGALSTGPAPTNTELTGIAQLLLSDLGLCEPTAPQIIGVDNKAIGAPA